MKAYLYVRVAEELRRRAKARAAEEGITLSEFVARAIESYVTSTGAAGVQA